MVYDSSSCGGIVCGLHWLPLRQFQLITID